MLAICAAAKPVVFKAPKPSSNAERVPQRTKPGAKPGHKKHSTSSKQPFVSIQKAIKGGSSKSPTGSKTDHLKRKKGSSSAMDSNRSQTLASTPLAIVMHKEDQQATGGPNSLGVTSEERVDPQLSSGMLAFNQNKPIYSASFIIHSEYALVYDASADSTAEADPGLSAPNDSVPQQQGMDEGNKNTSFDHLFAGTDPHVLADQTQSVSEGLENVLTQPITGKGPSSIARQVEEDEASRTIKLEDLSKLVSNVQPSFKDLDSPEDDPIIIVDDSDEDEEAEKDEAHTTINVETEDASVPKSSSPSSLPTKLKDLPTKFNELTKEVKRLKKQVHELEIELPGDLKEIPTKLEDFTKTVTSLTSQVAELKTLLNKVANALNQFAQAIASKKTKDTSVTSAGQAGEHIKKDKGIKAMSSEKAKNESTNSDFDNDETHLTVSIDESSKIKKKIEEDAKAEAAKRENEVRKEELVDLIGLEVVNKTGKGWKIIYDQIRSRMNYIHTTEAELGINLDIPLSKQDPLDKLNGLVNKKRKHADDIHDYFKANKRLKSSVQYEDHLAGTVPNELVLGSRGASCLFIFICFLMEQMTVGTNSEKQKQECDCNRGVYPIQQKRETDKVATMCAELEKILGARKWGDYNGEDCCVFEGDNGQKEGVEGWSKLNDLGKEAEERAREIKMEISEDLRLAREINALCARVTAIVDEGENFVDELDILAGRSVSGKMAEFMKQVQGKYIPNLMKLQIFGREFELRAREKGIFIEKLKGNLDF
ncbi:hypothetical protein Tco_0952125 [Tanacetum coccineum]|uniref:Uncharacterized protein n=1 Tax=Tanacetum coccineum TaxID=301880 RepID=A0ABQ5DW70_9ASTR